MQLERKLLSSRLGVYGGWFVLMAAVLAVIVFVASGKNTSSFTATALGWMLIIGIPTLFLLATLTLSLSAVVVSGVAMVATTLLLGAAMGDRLMYALLIETGIGLVAGVLGREKLLDRHEEKCVGGYTMDPGPRAEMWH